MKCLQALSKSSNDLWKHAFQTFPQFSLTNLPWEPDNPLQSCLLVFDINRAGGIELNPIDFSPEVSVQRYWKSFSINVYEKLEIKGNSNYRKSLTKILWKIEVAETFQLWEIVALLSFIFEQLLSASPKRLWRILVTLTTCEAVSRQQMLLNSFLSTPDSVVRCKADFNGAQKLFISTRQRRESHSHAFH